MKECPGEGISAGHFSSQDICIKTFANSILLSYFRGENI